jgi:hypothetical protein
LIAKFSAAMISGKPTVPSVSATGVSSRTMLAPGAIACEYSTSSEVSIAQPTMVEFDGSNGGTLPTGCSTLKLGGAGRPKPWSKVARSFLIVGEPYESTMTIVRPRPLRCLAYSGLRSYACWNCEGP